MHNQQTAHPDGSDDSTAIDSESTRRTNDDPNDEVIGNDSSQQVSEQAPQDNTLTKDEIFEVLHNSRRRYALYYLKRKNGTAMLGDLAESLALWEQDDSEAYLSHRERKRAYVSLYQVHLPKLDELDIVEYDQSRGTIHLGSGFEQVEQYLSRPTDRFTLHATYLTGVLVGPVVISLALISTVTLSFATYVAWFGAIIWIGLAVALYRYTILTNDPESYIEETPSSAEIRH